ncbi:MAG: hypothetical protein KHX03_07790 [Clostridium sp.]|nr:hypothetical protein [Clostridium sp.]
MPISPIRYSPIYNTLPQSHNKSQRPLSFGKLLEEDIFKKSLEESEDYTGKEKKKALEIVEKMKEFLEDPKFDMVYSCFCVEKANSTNGKDEDSVCYVVTKGEIDPENGKLGVPDDPEALKNHRINVIYLDDVLDPKAEDSVDDIVYNLKRFTRSRGIDTAEESLALSREKSLMDSMMIDDLPPSRWPKEPEEPFDPFSNPSYLDCWLP